MVTATLSADAVTTVDPFDVAEQIVEQRTLHRASQPSEREIRSLPARGVAFSMKHRDRGGHDLRSWYETRAIEDGADSLILRRTTHAAPKDVAGGYERFSWATICREVAKLQIGLLDGEILALGTVFGTANRRAENRWRKVVTPMGLEGVSVGVNARESTSSPRDPRLGEHPPPSSASPTVTSLGTALAAAVLAGDQVTAQRLARELLEHEQARAPECGPNHGPKPSAMVKAP